MLPPNLFTFLQHPRMAQANNAAERTIRPIALYSMGKGGTGKHKSHEMDGVSF